MWPFLLDMTKEESKQNLRCLELEAFASLASALRAQGTLTGDRLKLLHETRAMLHISEDRHKAEVRRVVNDEKLSTIAYHMNDQRYSADEWANEGQRVIPLIPRVAPQTVFSAIADEVADSASHLNKQLPLPACTERKRPLAATMLQSVTPSVTAACGGECGGGIAPKPHFRTVEPDYKKRKTAAASAAVTAAAAAVLDPAAHMPPPKMSQIQQLYRQTSKGRLKEHIVRMKCMNVEEPEYVMQQVLNTGTATIIGPPTSKQQLQRAMPAGGGGATSKINILQNAAVVSFQQQPLPLSPATAMVLRHQAPIDNPNLNVPNAPQIVCCTPNAAIVTTGTMVMEQRVPLLQATASTLPSKMIMTTDGQKLIVVATPQQQQQQQQQQQIRGIPMKPPDGIKLLPNTQQKVIRTTITSPVTTMASRKMIPFSQLQMVNTRGGGIKVLPFNVTNKVVTTLCSNGNGSVSVTTPVTPANTTTVVVSSSIPEDPPPSPPPAVQEVEVVTSEATNGASNIPTEKNEGKLVHKEQESNGVIEKKPVEEKPPSTPQQTNHVLKTAQKKFRTQKGIRRVVAKVNLKRPAPTILPGIVNIDDDDDDVIKEQLPKEAVNNEHTNHADVDQAVLNKMVDAPMPAEEQVMESPESPPPFELSITAEPTVQVEYAGQEVVVESEPQVVVESESPVINDDDMDIMKHLQSGADEVSDAYMGKVDLDSSLYIYGDAQEEVIDGGIIEEQPMEVVLSGDAIS